MTKEQNINRYLWQSGKRLLWNNPQKLKLYPTIKKIWPYTLNGFITLCQLSDHVNEVVREGIDGCFVEMGCWSGGSGAFLAWCAKKAGDKRVVWLFDSFQGLPQFTLEDKEQALKRGVWREAGKRQEQATGIFAAKPEKAKEAADLLGVADQVRVVKGWFHETVPEKKRELNKIALLYLDSDLYAPTKYCFLELYDLVSSGGIVVIDDFETWAGCRQAFYEFCVERRIFPNVRYYPFGGRLFFRKNH